MGGMEIEIVDPVADYAALMEQIFDFDAIRTLLEGGFTLRFDAMHAVTGPYATEILENRLGAAEGSVVNATPLPDFGGGHPDPNPVWADQLMKVMMGRDAPDFGAASDGDATHDRRSRHLRTRTASPCWPRCASRARLHGGAVKGLLDADLAPPIWSPKRRNGSCETPTGWKFFGNSRCGQSHALRGRIRRDRLDVSGKRTVCGRCW